MQECIVFDYIHVHTLESSCDIRFKIIRTSSVLAITRTILKQSLFSAVCSSQIIYLSSRNPSILFLFCRPSRRTLPFKSKKCAIHVLSSSLERSLYPSVHGLVFRCCAKAMSEDVLLRLRRQRKQI